MIDIESLKVRPEGVDVSAGRAVADDPDAPRRSMTRRLTPSPPTYAGTFSPPYPDWSAPRDEFAWEDRWEEHVAAHSPHDDLNSVDVDTRLAVYDAMPDDLRQQWEDAWRNLAHEWLDATADVYGDGDGYGPGGWGNVRRIGTADCGELLLFAHNEDSTGAAMWFEVVRFGLGEVAEACGITEPETWDVR